MVTYNDIYANLMRIESAINNPTLLAPVINLTGLSWPEGEQLLAGHYLAALADYHAAVQRGCDTPVVGYDELRHALEVLIAARQMAYLMGAPSQFSMGIFPPEECDDVMESLMRQECDEFSRTNILMLMGRAAIRTEQSDADAYEFSYWLNIQLHDLALFCYTHSIDLYYILNNMLNTNTPPAHDPSDSAAE